jgi:hypothetical protein
MDVEMEFHVYFPRNTVSSMQERLPHIIRMSSPALQDLRSGSSESPLILYMALHHMVSYRCPKMENNLYRSIDELCITG